MDITLSADARADLDFVARDSGLTPEDLAAQAVEQAYAYARPARLAEASDAIKAALEAAPDTATKAEIVAAVEKVKAKADKKALALE